MQLIKEYKNINFLQLFKKNNNINLILTNAPYSPPLEKINMNKYLKNNLIVKNYFKNVYQINLFIKKMIILYQKINILYLQILKI